MTATTTILGAEPSEIEAATSATAALAACRRRDPAVVVLDLSIDARRGVESGSARRRRARGATAPTHADS